MTEHRDTSLARELLRRAVSEPAPSLERVIENLPVMLAEAERRRSELAEPAARIGALGRVWLPRIAAATAFLLIAAWVWPQRQAQHDTTASLDGFIVNGNASARVADPVLDALVR